MSFKAFPVGRVRPEIRIEVANVFNHPNWGAPVTTYTANNLLQFIPGSADNGCDTASDYGGGKWYTLDLDHPRIAADDCQRAQLNPSRSGAASSHGQGWHSRPEAAPGAVLWKTRQPARLGATRFCIRYGPLEQPFG